MSLPEQPPGLPQGPHFAYEQAPSLFLGRSGSGPLDVVWDTNVLVDYISYGAAMWEGEQLRGIEDEYASELEGLQILIQVWQMREIRFRVFQRSIDDARRELEEQRLVERARAVTEFASALTLSSFDDSEEPATVAERVGERLPLVLPPTARDAALDAVPPGADRDLVRLSLEALAHVFLTRDKGILKAREALRPHGLLIATPLDLVEELAACGGLLCVLDRETAYWPVPDVQRLAHLIQALP